VIEASMYGGESAEYMVLAGIPFKALLLESRKHIQYSIRGSIYITRLRAKFVNRRLYSIICPMGSREIPAFGVKGLVAWSQRSTGS